MFRTLIFSATCLSAIAINVDSADAQGLRVSTVVYDAGRLDDAGREPAIASSFSLFQSGRVYDYVEAAGEVVIYEPSERRFTVLNPDRGVYTTIAFTELMHLLNERAPKTKAYIAELRQKNSPEADRAARMLLFQLNPEFETQNQNGMLSLKSPSWKYTVSTRPWEDTDQLQRYLTYTDWMAKLNYVLHPSSMFPEPRLALNAELRKLENRVPVVVQLDRRPDERLILRAEHQFVRSLTDHDHSLIKSWNESLKGTTLRELPFRSYQQTVLVTQSR